MAGRSYPTLDRFAPSWANLESTLDIYGGPSLDIFDLAGIKWSSKREIGEQRESGSGELAARTSGSKKHTFQPTFYASGLMKLFNQLVQVAPQDEFGVYEVGLVSFGWLIQWSLPGDNRIYSLRAEGLRTIGLDGSSAEGNEADKVEQEMSVGRIIYLLDDKEISI
jgi:hypothetical protein